MKTSLQIHCRKAKTKPPYNTVIHKLSPSGPESSPVIKFSYTLREHPILTTRTTRKYYGYVAKLFAHLFVYNRISFSRTETHTVPNGKDFN